MIKILVVCSGNICRSPYAELFLQSELDRLSPDSFSIRSAGSHALVGHQMDERSSMKLREIGVTSDGFASRHLNERDVYDVDLILALTDEHRQHIVEMAPKMLKRTYTVREFAAVLDELGRTSEFNLPRGADSTTVDARWTKLISVAQLARPSARKRLEGKLDVVDPYRKNNSVYDEMVEQLLPALRSIVIFESIYATSK